MRAIVGHCAEFASLPVICHHFCKKADDHFPSRPIRATIMVHRKKEKTVHLMVNFHFKPLNIGCIRNFLANLKMHKVTHIRYADFNLKQLKFKQLRKNHNRKALK